MADEYFDVIVVGGGIMGSCAAYTAAVRGHKTLLLEQFDFLHHRGSSHGESRTLRATYSRPHYTNLVLESVRLWERAQSEARYRVYFPSRQLDIGPSAHPALASIVQSCNSVGLGCRVLGPAQTAREFSNAVALPEGWVAVVSEVGGVIKATKAVSMFQALAARNGAVLADHVEVTRIEKTDGGILVTSGDNRFFRGKKCVVTAGPWTRSLVGEIPIQPLETSVMYWRVKEGYKGDFAIESGFPTFSSHGVDPHVFGTPSLEYPGLIKVALHTGRPCEPSSRTWAPLDTSAEVIGGWVRDKFGGRVEWEKPVMVQSCMYSVTPDEDFVIDYLGGVFERDVAVGAGFSGHGFKMGPVIGRILADMVLKGSVDGVNMSYFGLDRFKRNAKGNRD